MSRNLLSFKTNVSRRRWLGIVAFIQDNYSIPFPLRSIFTLSGMRVLNLPVGSRSIILPPATWPRPPHLLTVKWLWMLWLTLLYSAGTLKHPSQLMCVNLSIWLCLVMIIVALVYCIRLLCLSNRRQVDRLINCFHFLKGTYCANLTFPVL